MAKASDNVFPKVILGMNTTDPAAPADSSWKVYSKANGVFARSSNSIVGPLGGSGSGLTNPMTTTGDIIYSTDNSGTAARLAVGSNGQVLRTTSSSIPGWAVPPGFEFDYSQFTAAVSITATTEGTSNTVVTANAVTFDGSTTVMIEFYAPHARADTAAAARSLNLYMFEDGSSIGRVAAMLTPAANSDNKPVHVVLRRTPSNGSHTYSIRGFVNAGTGSVTAGIGGSGQDVPGFIRITKV